MPVEIKELIIRAVVESDEEESTQDPDDEESAPDMNEVVETCVKQVLRILKRSKER